MVNRTIGTRLQERRALALIRVIEAMPPGAQLTVKRTVDTVVWERPALNSHPGPLPEKEREVKLGIDNQ
jgi:hypothetical protein